MSRHLLWLTCFATILSVFAFDNRLSAQDDELSLRAPSAYERALAAARLEKDDLLTQHRQVLDDGGSAAQLIKALERLGTLKDKTDIPRIINYIGHLDPSVATASMQALRGFGRDALDAVKNLSNSQVDPRTRKDVTERLLKDHIYACCTRDTQINPFHLDFDSRFDELYSVDADIDDLLIRMVRESIGDIRDDIDGNRYYNYYYQYDPSNERPFVDYGGLGIAALAKSNPDLLLRETEELTTAEADSGYYYYWGNNRSPVTVELAAFFARNGKTAVMDKLINQMESSMRWMRGGDSLGVQSRIAAMQVIALGEYDAALDRLTEHLKQAGSAFNATVSQANYLRARILMKIGEEGAALHSLEESMEASNRAMVLVLVDSSFSSLQAERRFQAVTKYCELAARRLNEIERPWMPEDNDKE